MSVGSNRHANAGNVHNASAARTLHVFIECPPLASFLRRHFSDWLAGFHVLTREIDSEISSANQETLCVIDPNRLSIAIGSRWRLARFSKRENSAALLDRSQ